MVLYRGAVLRCIMSARKKMPTILMQVELTEEAYRYALMLPDVETRRTG